jgi:hypothetical protein
MNHILHNISLIILFVGIIMMTIYITKATSYNYMTFERKQQMTEQLRRKQPVREIYDYKISKEYEKMFSQPSIWFGYQDFDPEYKTEKLYIKN